jgi:sulfate transport system substrate-binding protein
MKRRFLRTLAAAGFLALAMGGAAAAADISLLNVSYDPTRELYKHVPVLDTGARGSTTTFVQRGIGDVLLAWENEAYLALDELGPDAFEIVNPSLSILAEPPVAIVDVNVDKKGTRDIAEEYLKYLYSAEGQTIAAANYYRPFKPELAKPEDIARFPAIKLATIADFGGWAEAQPKFFGDGGIFDQIYTPVAGQ